MHMLRRLFNGMTTTPVPSVISYVQAYTSQRLPFRWDQPTLFRRVVLQGALPLVRCPGPQPGWLLQRSWVDAPYGPRDAVQVTLPGSGQSFAFIYSVADPAGSNRFSGTAAQVRLCVTDTVLRAVIWPPGSAL